MTEESTDRPSHELQSADLKLVKTPSGDEYRFEMQLTESAKKRLLSHDQ